MRKPQHEGSEGDNPRRGCQVYDHGSVSECVFVRRAWPSHIASLDRGFFGALCSFGKSYGPANSVLGARLRVVDGASPNAAWYASAKRPSSVKPWPWAISAT